MQGIAVDVMAPQGGSGKLWLSLGFNKAPSVAGARGSIPAQLKAVGEKAQEMSFGCSVWVVAVGSLTGVEALVSTMALHLWNIVHAC